MNIDYHTTYDTCVPYRNIKIYPVTVKDYMMFNLYSQCLTIEKNIIPDAKIISMSNLEYIYYATQTNMEKTPYLVWFDRLMSLCLKDEDSFTSIEESMKRYEYTEKGKPFFFIGKELYTSTDFDIIKSIVCEQNMVELADDSISKEVRDSMEEARKYKQKLAGTKPASLEDYLIAMSVSTGWTLDYIYGLSIRKFTKAISRLDNLIHYKIYLSASMSGMVTFEDKSFIKHWLSGLDEKDKYDDVLMDLDTVQNKVSLESAKKK